MKYGRIEHVDKDVSRIGAGMIMLEDDKLDEGFAILDAAFDAGITFFDSAHMYGGGASDRVFGRWVRERGVCEKVVLFAKGCHHSGDTNRVTPECIAEDVGTILGNTGFDCIDIFAFHRDDESAPVGPLVEKLNELVSEGKIRAFGGSNWRHERIREANEYAEAKGLRGFSAASPQWSLAELLDEPWGRGSVTLSGDENREAREWYEANRMAVVTWSSLGGGFFTGNFTRDNLDSFESGGEKRTVRCYCGEDNFKRYDRAAELAKEKGATIPQVALAYLVTAPLNCFALMAAYDPNMARENAAAADIKLSSEERAWLDLRSDTR